MTVAVGISPMLSTSRLLKADRCPHDHSLVAKCARGYLLNNILVKASMCPTIFPSPSYWAPISIVTCTGLPRKFFGIRLFVPQLTFGCGAESCVLHTVISANRQVAIITAFVANDDPR